MNIDDYDMANNLKHLLSDSGLKLRRYRFEGTYVSADVTHDNWKDWGFCEDNNLSQQALSSVEELIAWISGFMSCYQFQKLCNSSKQPKE